MPLTTHTVTLTTRFPGSTLPLDGTWTLSVAATPAVFKETATGIVFGHERNEHTVAGVKVFTLEATGQTGLLPVDGRWQLSFRSDDGKFTLGPLVFNLTGPMDLDDILEVSGLPPTVTLLSQVLAARDEVSSGRLGYQNRPTKLVPDALRAWRPTSYGLVAPKKAATWRSSQSGVGMDVVWDHQRARYAIVYGADNGTSSQVGINFSDDLDNWDNADLYPNPIFGPNPIAGQVDSGGVTFPQLIWADSLWHMFYIAFPSPGFEVGTSRICLATCPTLSTVGTDWTRRGVMLDPQSVPWIASAFPVSGVLYRPCVVQNDDGSWGMFYNGGEYSTEDIGYASATALTGPWTARATKVLTATAGPGANALVSDPDVFRVGTEWYMLAWQSVAGRSQLVLAHTSQENYPAGWTYYPTPVLDNALRGVYVNAPDGARVFTFTGDGPRINKPTRTATTQGTRTVSGLSGGRDTTGTWLVNVATAHPGGVKRYNQVGAQNDAITYELNLDYGSYEFDFVYSKDANSGVFGILIDGVQVATFDAYAAGAAAVHNYVQNVFVPRDGLHRVTLKMVSKHASSGGYYGGWHSFGMTKLSG